jgi:hypothetical protein
MQEAHLTRSWLALPLEELDPVRPGEVVELELALATPGEAEPSSQADNANTVAANTASGAISDLLAPFITGQLYEPRGHTEVTAVTSV